METIKNTSVLIVLAGIFYSIYQIATGSTSVFPSTGQQAQLNQSENLADATAAPILDGAPNGLNAALPNGNRMPSNSQNGGLKPNVGLGSGGGLNPGQGQGLNPPPSFSNNSAGSAQGQPALPSLPNPSLQSRNPSTAGGGINSLPSPNLQQPKLAKSRVATADLQQGSVDQIPGRNSDHRQFGGESPNNGEVVRFEDGTRKLTPINGFYFQKLKEAMESAGRNIQAGRKAVALKELTPWLDKPLSSEDRARLLEWLDPLASEVIYSKQHTLFTAYRSVNGDTFRSIAKRHSITPYALANINQLKVPNFDAELPLGTELKIVQGPFLAKADLKKNELTISVDGMYAGRFRFQLGNSSPIKNDTSFVSQVSVQGLEAQQVGGGQRIPPMGQGNPYGKYCIIFGDNVLHSQGNQSENGCMIFSDQDMVDLIALLSDGSKVTVQK